MHTNLSKLQLLSTPADRFVASCSLLRLLSKEPEPSWPGAIKWDRNMQAPVCMYVCMYV